MSDILQTLRAAVAEIETLRAENETLRAERHLLTPECLAAVVDKIAVALVAAGVLRAEAYGVSVIWLRAIVTIERVLRRELLTAAGTEPAAPVEADAVKG